ncbi:hypothetical protein [Neisseria sp. P0014.S006]
MADFVRPHFRARPPPKHYAFQAHLEFDREAGAVLVSTWLHGSAFGGRY